MGGRHILSGDAAAHDYAGSDGSKIFGVGLDERGALIRRGLALDLDAVIPVIVFHGSVSADADISHDRKFVKALLHRAIESFQLASAISGALRIDVNDITVAGVELEVGALEFGQALCEQARAHEE